MRLADTDPMAVLPVTAARASATFARVVDADRDRSERLQQLMVLQACLVSVGRLLERCHSEAALLANELAESLPSTEPCPAPLSACRHCVALLLSPSGDRAGCSRCGRFTVLPPSGRRCESPPTVKIRDSTGAEQVLCLAHAAVRRGTWRAWSWCPRRAPTAPFSARSPARATSCAGASRDSPTPSAGGRRERG